MSYLLEIRLLSCCIDISTSGHVAETINLSITFAVMVVWKRTLINAESSFMLEQNFSCFELLIEDLSENHALEYAFLMVQRTNTWHLFYSWEGKQSTCARKIIESLTQCYNRAVAFFVTRKWWKNWIHLLLFSLFLPEKRLFDLEGCLLALSTVAKLASFWGTASP